MEISVSQLAQQIAAKLVGDGTGQIKGVTSVDLASEDMVTFITSDKYLSALEKSKARAVIVGVEIKETTIPQLVVDNVDAALIKTLGIFAPNLKTKKAGIDATAIIADSTRIGKGVYVGAGVVVDDDVEIGNNSVIDAGCKIGQNSRIGKNCRLDCNVVVYHSCTIGNGVIIQANATIGSTGFGYAVIDNLPVLIPHNGGVIIEDFVEIGAGVCIDRAKFDNTIIGTGTKIDNLVQIGHNVSTGKCCLIAGQAGISGSSKLGDGVVLAGQVGLVDNIEIGDRVVVGAQSGVTRNIEAGKQIFGMPAVDLRDAKKQVCLVRRLPKMAEQLKQLNKRVEKLEASENDKN
ncbi:MAG: UDP-3-O-(3-hydroxymyristoyl)glucosamine N-acyltransferase [Planctomycetota bacterium]|jgi:UDP-3-O-[3-hydroxymyristoyl] glucosamine N-acyltransferase